MKLLLAIALLFPGCAVTPATSVHFRYDPETKLIEASFDRAWQSGPVLVRGRYSAPDGTAVDFVWCSDVELRDAAGAREAQLERIEAIARNLLELALGAAIPNP